MIIIAVADLLGLLWVRRGRAIPVAHSVEIEILVLRHQLNVLRRRSPLRVAVGNIDRLVFAGLHRPAPELRDGLKTRSSDGIAPASEPGGAGNHDRAAVDRSFGHSVERVDVLHRQEDDSADAENGHLDL